MLRLLMVFLGGAVGASLRYGVTLIPSKQILHSFPLNTFLVNTIGSLLIGFLFVVFSTPSYNNDNLKVLIIIGLLGGFTTFSSFSLDTLNLFNNNQYGMALLYVLITNIVCLLFVFVGYKLANSFI